jgi:hypothetical protein
MGKMAILGSLHPYFVGLLYIPRIPLDIFHEPLNLMGEMVQVEF